MPPSLSRRGFVASSLAVVAAAGGAEGAQAARSSNPLPHGVDAARIKQLLSRMSLADKIAQVNIPLVLPQFLHGDDSTDPTGTPANQEKYVRGGVQVGRLKLGPGGGFFGLVNESVFGSFPLPDAKTPREQALRHNALQKIALGTELGIPLLQVSEGTHGSVGPGSTVFPEGLGLGATWNPALIGEVYSVVATEARAVGIHAVSTVMAELTRDPRYGRAIWSFSEDPWLTSQYVASLVPALQGDDLRADDAVIASLCTFPLESPNIGGLEGSAVELGERELRSVHLPPWRAGFSAGALMTEASEQVIDGISVHGSPKYLTGLLREELGFAGAVIGIGFDGLTRDRVAADDVEAGALALKAGLDINVGWRDAYLQSLKTAIDRGLVSERLLDRAVTRVLALKQVLGLFDHPYVDAERAQRIVNQPSHRAIAARVARESMVLLRNEGGLLPIKPGVRRLAVIGPNADDAQNLLGDYAAAPQLHDVPSILAGIRAVAGSRSISYAKGCEVTGDDRSGFAAAVKAAKQSELAIVVLGEETKGGYLGARTNGELADVSSLDLSGVQQELLEAVSATGTPVVLVLVNGRALSVRWAAEHVPATLEAWLPGEQGGQAVADVLFGVAEPGGRLPVTFPRSVGQLPMYYNQKGSRFHSEGYVDLPGSPLYPFGFGLSYTTFSWGKPQLTTARINRSAQTEVQVEVTNSGKRAGTEVVQLYVTDVTASVALPEIQLKGAQMVTLEPGAKATVRLVVRAEDLALVNAAGSLVVEPGDFDLHVGTSSTSFAATLRLTVR
ncbi:beta-glucosidase [Kribbella voronezhensis]|uniref:Exo-alpha-(1->6)-L-arabinopyranosidase n=1 Tax=Kribbella voronezhensis TaxID=2512212 RepID=A0A4R7T6V8_9ACTN|nr:glycoside hydrolase family 3 C-terminal domain-containing protein [Kribbella voronezhensis]TDU87640.1 beta-glucosidase [Kribbella voronezhensis]